MFSAWSYLAREWPQYLDMECKILQSYALLGGVDFMRVLSRADGNMHMADVISSTQMHAASIAETLVLLYPQ
jgi:hypothetical protein